MIFESPHNGTLIRYWAPSGVWHAGLVVGQDESGEWLYVKSNLVETGNVWDFQVRSADFQNQIAAPGAQGGARMP